MKPNSVQKVFLQLKLCLLYPFDAGVFRPSPAPAPEAWQMKVSPQTLTVGTRVWVSFGCWGIRVGGFEHP